MGVRTILGATAAEPVTEVYVSVRVPLRGLVARVESGNVEAGTVVCGVGEACTNSLKADYE